MGLARTVLALALATVVGALVLVLRGPGAGAEPAARPPAASLTTSAPEEPAPAEPDELRGGVARSEAAAVEPEPERAAPPALREGGGEPASPRGQVIEVGDRRGRPIEGARVRIVRPGEGDPEVHLTGPDGTCSLPAREAGVALHVDADGFDHALGSGDRPLLLSPLATLRGRVVERGTGVAIPGATVKLHRFRCDYCRRPVATTDANGRFALEGVPLAGSLQQRGGRSATSTVIATAEGYLASTREFELRDERAELLLELEPGVELYLAVVDAETGAPLPGARIRRGPLEETVGADGTLRSASLLEAAPGDSVPIRLTVSADSYVDLVLPVDPAAVDPGRLVELPLLRSVTLVADLRDSAGEPFRTGFSLRAPEDVGARLAAAGHLPEGWAYAPPARLFAFADERGGARIEGLLPRTGYEAMMFSGSHGVHEGMAVEPGEPGAVVEQSFTVEVPPQASATGTVRGHLHSGARPLEAFVVWTGPTAEGSSGVGPDGHFEIEGVEAGPVKLVFGIRPHWPAGLGFFEACRELLSPEHTVDVAPDEVTEVDVDLGLPMTRLSGRVVLADGSPAAGRRVHAEAPGMCLLDGVVTDQDGRFELWTRSDVSPQTIVVPHGTGQHRRGGVRPDEKDLVVEVPEFASLAWRALDAAGGEPLEEVSVRWRPTGVEEYQWARSNADPSGWHHLELAAGRYDLCVSAAGEHAVYLPAFREAVLVAPEADPLTVELEPGLEVEVTLAEGLEPWPWDEVSVYLLDGGLAAAPSVEDPTEPDFGTAATGREMAHFQVSFQRSRTDRLRGLQSGTHRFHSFPDTLVLEPAEVVVGPDTPPIELRWRYR